MKGRLWVLVADAARARLLEWNGRALHEVADFAHPEGHLKNQDLVSDQVGRKGSPCGRPGLEDRHSPKDSESDRFALALADQLKQGQNHHLFDHLMVVAPPRFLGRLRQVLDPHVSKSILMTFDHDYVELSLPELSDRLNLAASR